MYRYPEAPKLHGSPTVRDGECVALIQHFTKAPHTTQWRQGAHVVDGPYVLMPGTAIATFVNGKYPQVGKGNRHAAFFLHYGAFDDSGLVEGIWIMEQYTYPRVPFIKARFIKREGFPKLPDGRYQNASNNAGAFYVIE